MYVDGSKLSMTRGDSESIIVKIKDYAFTTGDVIRFTIRRRYDTEAVVRKVVTAFESDGSAVISILPEDTEGLRFGKYQYDVEWTNSQGGVRTIIKPTKDNFVLTEEVTYND